MKQSSSRREGPGSMTLLSIKFFGGEIEASFMKLTKLIYCLHCTERCRAIIMRELHKAGESGEGAGGQEAYRSKKRCTIHDPLNIFISLRRVSYSFERLEGLKEKPSQDLLISRCLNQKRI